MKLNYKNTFLLGFGFLGVSVVWTFYNSFVPIILKGFIASNALIGLIMTFDNILAVTIQPIITDTVAWGSMIYTDEYDIYDALPSWGFQHKSVNTRCWLR